MIRRAVIDTNIIISALFWNGTPGQVMAIFESKQSTLLLSDEILSELEHKLNSTKFTSRISALGRTPAQIIDHLRNIAEIVAPAEVPEDAVRDRKDRIILGCGVGGEADCIVSGDKDLTDLKTYTNIPILTAAQFLKLMDTQAEDEADEQ